MIIIWAFLPKHEDVMAPKGLNLSTLKWEDFVEDCGRKVIFSNAVRAKRNFELKYETHFVTWSGVVFAKIPSHQINDPYIEEAILIKMNPSDSKEEYPDIQLLFYKKEAEANKDAIAKVQVGDVVNYRAGMKNMGDEFHYHSFECKEFTITGERTDINAIPMIQYSGNIDNKLRREKQDNQQVAVPSPSTKTEAGNSQAQNQTDQPKEQTQPVQENKDQTNNQPVDENPNNGQENLQKDNQNDEQEEQDNQIDGQEEQDNQIDEQEEQDNQNDVPEEQDNQNDEPEAQDNQDGGQKNDDANFNPEAQTQAGGV
jgi:hypothetical protein